MQKLDSEEEQFHREEKMLEERTRQVANLIVEKAQIEAEKASYFICMYVLLVRACEVRIFESVYKS